MKLFLSFFLVCCIPFIQGCTKPNSEISGSDNKPIQRIITAKGQAIIKNGAKLLARKQAFRNAINNVTVQVDNNLRTDLLLGSTKVVDEWIENKVYYLQVLTVISNEQQCSSPYRKKLLATGFPIASAGQITANETQDLYSGIPREIMNILIESGGFTGKNKTHTVLFSRPDMAPEIEDQHTVIRQLAQQHQSQFVLSGVIRDLEVESTEYVRGAGIFAQAKSLMRDFVARRGVGIDIYVHDGISGSLLFQQRYTNTAIGDVWIPSGYTVGSERFKSTPTGNRISEIIQSVSKDIRQLFSCYPFSAQIIKVENKKVYIAAGAQDKLKPGDNLVVYTTNLSTGLLENELIGIVSIQNVQTNFSIGQMELVSDVRRIKAGDFVKSW